MTHLAATCQAVGVEYEIVVVNDGSADATGGIIDAVAAANPRVMALHHERNRGIGGGILTAARHARCDKAIICPVDSPHSAEQLRVFLAAAAADAIVVGYRPERVGYMAWQQLGSQVYHLMVELLFRLRLKDVNWIHLYPTRLFADLQIEFGGIVYLTEVLVKARKLGYGFVEVPSPMTARVSGVATISKPGAIWRTFKDLWKLWWRVRKDSPDISA